MKNIFIIITVGFCSFSNTILLSQSNDTIQFLSRDYSDYRCKFGGGFGMGGAYINPLGNFKEITGDYKGLDINYSLSYNHIIYDFNWAFGRSNSQGTFVNNELTLVQDSSIHVTSIENSIGYMIIDKRFLLYPWAGVSTTKIGQNNQMENNDGPYKTSTISGITIGYRLLSLFSDSRIDTVEFRTKLAYTNLQYFNKLNLSNIRFGWSFVLYFRKVERRNTI